MEAANTTISAYNQGNDYYLNAVSPSLSSITTGPATQPHPPHTIDRKNSGNYGKRQKIPNRILKTNFSSVKSDSQDLTFIYMPRQLMYFQ